MYQLLYCLTLLVALFGWLSSGNAQSPADFYRDKTISLYVGYPPGGGYDVYARALARYMGKFIPGAPHMVVRNQPGAASLAFANELYNTHPRDGMVFGTFARSVPMDRLLERPSTNFDPTQFNWIGSANAEISICTVWHGIGVRSVENFMSRPIVFGANAPGSESDVYPTILNNLLGANFKVVTGYPGTNDLMMAMERGETQGRCGMTWSALKSTLPDWVREKKVYIARQFAIETRQLLEDQSEMLSEYFSMDIKNGKLVSLPLLLCDYLPQVKDISFFIFLRSIIISYFIVYGERARNRGEK